MSLAWSDFESVFLSIISQKLDLSGIEPDVRQFEEKFGKRVLVSCNDLSFNLQGCVADTEEGPTTNVRVGNLPQTGHSFSWNGTTLKCNYLNKKKKGEVRVTYNTHWQT